MSEGVQERAPGEPDRASSSRLGGRPFELAEWLVRPIEGTATCGSRTVRLEPKVMAVLAYLVEKAGEVVPKEEILDEVWRGTHVKEVVLARGISELRRLLGDDARAPRLIETLPKRGYRLIADIRPPTPAQPKDVVVQGQERAATSRRGWCAAWLILAALLSAAYFGSRAKPHPGSIAVLPLVNFSGDPESDYFSNGMTEDILTALSKIGALKVVSRTSSMTYKETDKTLPEIGRELRVASIVEGSVRREGGTVRVTAQLIDVATDRNLWSGTYDRRLEDIFEIQRDVADRIARALEAELSPQEQSALDRQPTLKVTAHDAYLRGREQYLRYEHGANELAIELYRSALEVDPNHALARAGLASAYALRVANFDHEPEEAEQALSVAQQALELDPELPEAHKALGMAYAISGRLQQARSSYRRALELRPDYDEAMHNIALLLFQLGEWDEAGRWQRRSVELQRQLK